MDASTDAKRVLVIGAGFAGMRAALDLADLGLEVTLIERRSAPGGTLPQLDLQYPTVDCGACQIQESHAGPPWPEARCLRTGVGHPSVETLTSTELVDTRETEDGRFHAMLRRGRQWVDSARCTGCGVCAEVCPVDAVDEHQAGTCSRKAAYRRHELTDPPTFVIDEAACTKCGDCVEACPEAAIELDRPAVQESRHVDAVIVATGFTPFDPRQQPQWAYGRHPDVVTALELERLAAPRREGGPAPLRRPSDGAPVERVAFVQCVGSRDTERPWCSAICCMHSLKESIMLREQLGVPQCDIYAIDLRCTGKAYEQTAQRAFDAGVRLVHARPGAVEAPSPQARPELRVELPDGSQSHEAYDLVVLATGVVPSPGMATLAERLSIELQPSGFVAASDASPVATSRAGVFACGAASGPCDIPWTITTASQAALAAAAHAGLPGIGSRHAEPAEPLGLPPRENRLLHLTEIAPNDDGLATEPMAVVPRALVLGAGPAGLNAARTLGRAGVDVVVVDKREEAGGHLREARRLMDGGSPAALLEELLAEVAALDNVELLLGWELEAQRGAKGSYSSLLREPRSGRARRLNHGAFIVATGCAELDPGERFGSGHERVITQRQLEALLGRDDTSLLGERPTVVMIQCVGSREPGHPDCSRVCCHESIKNALWLTERTPEARVIILHRDIRTVGFDELAYAEARKRGVVAIRVPDDAPPTVEPTDDGVILRFEDPLLRRPVRVDADLVALSTGLRPTLGAELANVLGLRLDRGGFVEEANRKYRTTEASRRGTLLAGAAAAPVLVPEAMTQGEAAALRAIALLSRDALAPRPGAAAYRPKWCAACGLCIDVCPAGARELDEELGAVVHVGLCQGCGGCAAACPSGCTEQPAQGAKGIMDALDSALEVLS